MNVFTLTKRFSHCLIMALTLAILSACSLSALSPEDTPPELFSKLNNNSAFFLKKAELGSAANNQAWQFAAVQALIAEKQFTLADSIIEYLQAQPLKAAEQSALSLLIADNLYAQNESEAAQQALDKVDNKQLSEIGLVHFLKLQIQLQIAQEDHLSAAENLFLLAPLLKTAEEKQQYNDILLTQLSLLPIDFLNQYSSTAEDTQSLTEAGKDLAEMAAITAENVPPVDSEQQFKQGWYALAGLYQRYQLRPNQLLRSLADWQARYPTHPLVEFMPTQLTNIPELSPYQPENIAVLIPLSGRFKQQGQAIQYGLLHAFYNQQQRRQGTAEQTVSAAAPTFHFFDTQAQSMEQIAAQFQEQNIDFVIGPLQKNNVETFLPLVTQIPVLTLNSFPETPLNELPETENKQIAWHYAFPISPEEEAKQAAQLIFAQHHKKPLVLAPDSDYGKRLAQAFSEQWTVLNKDNNSQSEAYFFNNKARLAPFIAQALQTEQSKGRIAQMKMITGLPLKTKVRSRRDIDAIYIISKRDELILLKPFIDVAISPFAPSIPLYASSRSHLQDNNRKQNKELSKLTFSDSPFLLDTDNKTFKEVQQAWKNQSLATLRFFALGFDSYQLIGQLMQLQSSENYTYNGLIGQLSLDQTNTLKAQLSWAKYQQGELIEVTTPVSAE